MQTLNRLLIITLNNNQKDISTFVTFLKKSINDGNGEIHKKLKHDKGLTKMFVSKEEIIIFI